MIRYYASGRPATLEFSDGSAGNDDLVTPPPYGERSADATALSLKMNGGGEHRGDDDDEDSGSFLS
jgi:hypothetical protein